MKKILFTVLLFVLFYFEALSIGSFQITILWKIPILLYLIFNVFGESLNSNIILFGYFVAFKNILTIEPINNFMTEFIELSYFIILPLTIHFLVSTKKIKIQQTRKFLFLLANAIIIINIPIFLGLIKPIGNITLGYFNTNINSFYGVFGPHDTAVYLALSLIIIIYFLKFTTIKYSGVLYFYYAVFFIGIVMLFNTFVRTGWFMFIIGIFVLYVDRIDFKNLQKLVIFLIVGSFLLGTLFLYSEPFRERLLDERANQVDAAFTEKAGSGRFEIWNSYLEIWKETNILGKIIGISNDASQKIYEKKYDSPLFAHNEFLNMLVSNGIIGLVLLLLYIKFIYTSLNNHIIKNERKLFMAIFFMWMVCMFVQQANYFLQNIILGIIISISIYTQKYIKALKSHVN